MKYLILASILVSGCYVCTDPEPSRDYYDDDCYGDCYEEDYYYDYHLAQCGDVLYDCDPGGLSDYAEEGDVYHNDECISGYSSVLFCDSCAYHDGYGNCVPSWTEVCDCV